MQPQEFYNTVETDMQQMTKAAEDINTIIRIAYQRAVMNREKFDTSKRQIVLDAAVELLKAGLQKSLIASTLKKKLANKETGIHKSTVYRALQTPEFKEFKSESRSAAIKKGKTNKAKSHVRPSTVPITIAVSNSGKAETEPETNTNTNPEPTHTKIKPEDMIFEGLKQSGDRNDLINKLLDDLSGIDEIQRNQIIKKATKGCKHELIEYCKDHILDIVIRIPDIQIGAALTLAQQLLALLQEYESGLHNRWMKRKSESELV